MSIEVLSGLLEIQQFYVLQHLWLLKLTDRHPDILAKVTGVNYDRIPDGLREAVKRVLPFPTPTLVPTPQPAAVVEVPVATPAPPEPASQPKEAKTVKKYGHLYNRVEELVTYVRTHPPKTVEQLGRFFGVESSCVRRYLYAMYAQNVNVDVPRKVLWKGRNTNTVPPYMVEQLKQHPADIVEIPITPTQKAQAPTTPATPRVSGTATTIATLEKLVLANVRAGNMETVKVLAQALEAVESSDV